MEEGEKRKITEERRVLQYLFVSLHLVIFDCVIQFILLMRSNLSNSGVCVCVAKERSLKKSKMYVCLN